MGIDLGTSNVCIYMRDKGIVINQPAIVAYQPKENKIIAVGSKAKRMMGKTPEGIVVETPLSGGGTCLWVPSHAVRLGTKRVTEFST